MQFVKSPDELAFVIAHEIGHFVKGHLDAVVVNWMGNVTGNSGFNILANVLETIRFPWQMEYEADSAAVRYMHTAGYNIDDAIAIMKRLSEKHGDCHVCSHPPTSERLAKIETLVASLKYQNQNIKLAKTQKLGNKMYAKKSAKIYHTRNCSLINDLKEDQLIHFNSAKEAEEAGGEPCKQCQP